MSEDNLPGDSPTPPPTPTPNPEVLEKGSPDLISQANAAAARLEQANIKMEELIGKQEKMQVQQLLGGKTDAGAPPKEETPEEYAKKVMGGEQ
jgi:hypothetical protein